MQGFLKLLFFFAFLAGVAYFGQALILVPGLWSSTRIKIWEKPSPVPNQVEKFLVSSGSDAELEAWHLPAAVGDEHRKVALFLHSENSSLRASYKILKWLSKFGLEVYSVDYQGFGISNGWPTEAHFEQDADATLKKIAEREHLAASEVVLIGDSMGGALAAHLAASAGTKYLFILNPYASFAEKLGEPMRKHLDKVVHFKFPTSEHLRKVSGACVLLFANENSNPEAFTYKIKNAATEKNNFQSYFSSTTNRSIDLLQQFQAQITQAFSNCSTPS